MADSSPLATRGSRRSPVTRGSQLATRSSPQLPPASDLGYLVAIPDLLHTRFTYHRTWETGLGTEIRVAGSSPDFFVLPNLTFLANTSR
jgi:hypothetical protein